MSGSLRRCTETNQHTAGPWRVAPQSVGRYKVVATNGGKVVGEASGYNEQADSNARLIAAAPELLAALEKFCLICPNVDMPVSSFDSLPMAEAIAAVRKARGY